MSLHIESCPTCRQKVLELTREKDLFAKHFAKYQIPSDIKRELKTELNEVFDSFTPKLKDKVKEKGQSLNKGLKLNAYHFFLNMIHPRNIKILIVTGIAFYVTKLLMNP